MPDLVFPTLDPQTADTERTLLAKLAAGRGATAGTFQNLLPSASRSVTTYSTAVTVPANARGALVCLNCSVVPASPNALGLLVGLNVSNSSTFSGAIGKAEVNRPHIVLAIRPGAGKPDSFTAYSPTAMDWCALPFPLTRILQIGVLHYTANTDPFTYRLDLTWTA